MTHYADATRVPVRFACDDDPNEPGVVATVDWSAVDCLGCLLHQPQVIRGLTRADSPFAHVWVRQSMMAARCEHCRILYNMAEERVRKGECPVLLRRAIDEHLAT